MTLAPAHRADLEKSGLTESTIDALQCTSLRPKEVPLKSAESAFQIPYFDIHGQPNRFYRLKLMPAISDPNGHKIKYWQPADTAPHLYLAPLLPWEAIATDPTWPLYLIEGEKKAAAGIQSGLTCAGIGGVWAWRGVLENGDKLTLPQLDEFRWTNRAVRLLPDSDVWRASKEQALRGFFALGKELQARGAQVEYLVLPDLGSGKCGLDDWLLVPGNNAEGIEYLDRLTLNDPRFTKLTSWWHKWKDQQLTRQAIEQRHAEALTMQETAGHYAVHSGTHHVQFVFDRVTEQHGGIHSEVSVILGATEVMSGMDLSLKSDDKQTRIVGTLKKLSAAVPWKILLQKACSMVVKRHREGTPIVQLLPVEGNVPFLLNPLVYDKHPTLLYAPGGSCKSYLALWLALLACHGAQAANIAGIQTGVLYLDWELNEQTVGGRLRALQAGHPELSLFTPYYRRCEYPLTQEAHQIAVQVAKLGIGLLIVDSVGMACGSDLASPEAAISLQRAFRQIGCASLTLAHVAKNTPEGQARSAYGTVFFRELARNTWELQKAEQENPAKLILTQDKNNFGPRQKPLGLTVTFAGDAVTIAACDPETEPDLEIALPIANRIRNLLEDGELWTAKEIADALGQNLTIVKPALSRYRGRKWQRIGDGKEGQWTVLS